MNRKSLIKAIIGIVVIGGALTYFIYTAMQSSWAYYISVDDLSDEVSPTQTQVFRVAGNVGKGSIIRDIKNMKIDFQLTGQKSSLPVTYTGVVPENFAEGREVVAEGRLAASGTFQADKLMTKCESKYEAKLNEGETKQ